MDQTVHALTEVLTPISRVIASGMCIGCGACVAVSPSIRIRENAFGEYVADIHAASEVEQQRASKVCPFADGVANESIIARQLYGDAQRVAAPKDDSIGYFSNLYAGYSTNHRDAGASGGLATWLLETLLKRNLVDWVINVAPGKVANTAFAYRVTNDPAVVKEGSTAFYYPVSLADVLEHVHRTPGRYAVTGVPCFIKALRLLQQSDPVIRERIRYTVGIVCGQMKSTFYLEYLKRRAGASGPVLRASFRKKDHQAPADNYMFEVTTNEDGVAVTRSVRNRSIGANWGMGLFKPLACDYCDDVFAETADVALMDAWIPEYVKDGRGTSLAVVRSDELNAILQAGVAAKELILAHVGADRVVESQRGGLNHRRAGLAYRLFLGERLGVWRPRKRVRASSDLDALQKLDQKLRALLRICSRSAMRRQMAIGEGLVVFDVLMFVPVLLFRVTAKLKSKLRLRQASVGQLDASSS